jgi:hypothetical protein
MSKTFGALKTEDIKNRITKICHDCIYRVERKSAMLLIF